MRTERSGASGLRLGWNEGLQRLVADEARLAALAARLGVALALVLAAFVAFYVYDRYLVVVETPLDQAVRELEDQVRQSPNDAELRLQVANAYARQRRFDQAITQYNEALKLKPNWQPALLAMAATELARGNERQAEAIYRQVAEANKESEFRYASRDLGLVYYRLAAFASRDGRHAEAASWAQEALKVDRTDADALFLLAQSQEAQGDQQAAREAYRQAVWFDPNFREAFAGLARTATTLGDPTEAAYARGMELLAAGDVDGALAGFRRLTQEAPAYAEAFQGLGLAYGKRGQREEAASAFRAALERRPDLLLAQWSLRSLEEAK